MIPTGRLQYRIQEKEVPDYSGLCTMVTKEKVLQQEFVEEDDVTMLDNKLVWIDVPTSRRMNAYNTFNVCRSNKR